MSKQTENLVKEELPDQVDFFLREEENDFSFWYPKVQNCGIKTPETYVYKICARESQEEKDAVERLYRAFYMDNPEEDFPIIQNWVNSEIVPHLQEKGLTGHLFVKNGRFSNKFNANRSCCIYGLDELANAIASINYEALCVGADGLDEVVVRQFIEYNHAKTPCIYNGLPLRPEFRVFYDFDTRKVLYSANYWDYETVYPHLYDATDKIIFEHERRYMEDSFYGKRQIVEAMVGEAMKNVEGLTGQWSVDILYDDRTNTYWLIDMAIAQRSAYWKDPSEQPALKPFVVEIEELYRAQVVVYAESLDAAETKIINLCSDNTIPCCRPERFEGRSVLAHEITDENRHLLEVLDHYGKEEDNDGDLCC